MHIVHNINFATTPNFLYTIHKTLTMKLIIVNLLSFTNVNSISISWCRNEEESERMIQNQIETKTKHEKLHIHNRQFVCTVHICILHYSLHSSIRDIFTSTHQQQISHTNITA